MIITLAAVAILLAGLFAPDLSQRGRRCGVGLITAHPGMRNHDCTCKTCTKLRARELEQEWLRGDVA